ncbi:MAG: NAD(P)-dependent oxidoreductase [Nitrospiraceae bacterium]|nr:NAD(P)-dependent oxidoreductase [Nitrospiraceae bacterium]
MTARRALITGATGFVGSRLAYRLVHDGWDVTIVVRPGSDRLLVKDFVGRLTVYEHDGTTVSMTSLVRQTGPEVVFHLASLFLSQHRASDIEPLIRSNILFGTQLLEAMAAADVRLLVNAGTSWQHYEGRAYSPVNLYAATKQAFETILQYYLETSSLRVITLKLFDTYGPGDPRPKLFHLLRRTAESRQPLAMSPGEQLIDLVHIDDVVNAFVLAAQRLASLPAGHETYSVSSGAPLRLRDLVALYEQVTGATLPITWGGRPYRPREVMTPWHDERPLPGWSPKISLEEGIRQLR